MPKPIALKDNIVVHPIGEKSVTGMIHIPNAYRKKINNGIVVSKGPDVSADISIGDHVGFGAYDGKQVTLENGQFYILNEDSIACKYLPGDVKLIDTETMKRLINERITEMKSKDWMKAKENQILSELEESLIDRIDTITIAEGFEL